MMFQSFASVLSSVLCDKLLCERGYHRLGGH